MSKIEMITPVVSKRVGTILYQVIYPQGYTQEDIDNFCKDIDLLFSENYIDGRVGDVVKF